MDKVVLLMVMPKFSRSLFVLLWVLPGALPAGGIIDVSGVYSSEVKGQRPAAIDRKTRNPEVRLEQTGTEIKGTYGKQGEIVGKIDENHIKFEWFNGSGGRGWGVWEVKPGSTEISGSWQSSWMGKGSWNLVRSEPLILVDTPPPAGASAPAGKDFVQVASGTGFAVSEAGHLVTNYHVIQGCTHIDVYHQGEAYRTKLLYSDPVNDLAVLQADFVPNEVFRISRRNPQIMQEIYVAGYPFGDQVSSSVKVTKGIVSSLSGIGNNVSNIQIDAALQPGNSGGPIFDVNGNVIGVAVAKLSLKKIIKNWGVVPENTNFGVKSTVVVNLLESNGIIIQEASAESVSNSELGRVMTGATFHLGCYMTLAQLQKMLDSKVVYPELSN